MLAESRKERIVILASGRGTLVDFVKNFCDLYRRHIQLVAVGADRYSESLLHKCEKLKLPTFVIDYQDYPRKEWNELLASSVELYEPSILFFLGFKRIVNLYFLERFHGKLEMINIHPSLLPKYKGMRAIERAIENSDRYIGSTLHTLSEDVDSGQILHQLSIQVDGIEYQHIRERLYLLEQELLYRYLIEKI
jgi:phosphoribosylglycinamide formyltransferase-1